MAQINTPIDIADAVQAALNAVGINACADPLPRNMENDLPITLVQPIGGSRSAIILDRRAVRLYTWAATYADADVEARVATAALCALEGETLGGVPLYRTAPTSLPYTAYDPDHPNVPRVAQTLDLYVRALTTTTD